MYLTFCYTLLYISPIFISLITRSEISTFAKFVISLIPILSVIPSSYVYLYIHNKEVEHIIRHGWYSMSFLIGSVTINWMYIAENLDDDNVLNFLVFFVFAFSSLFYFTISHIFEYKGYKIYTHHGDVSILPLTLVSIAYFYNEIPDEVFILTRVAPIIIIVMVSWSTIHLTAFLQFATNCTTRHSQNGFSIVTSSAYVTAAIFLILIELQAAPVYFFSFALISGIFMQFMRRHDEIMYFQKNSFILLLLLLFSCSICAIIQLYVYDHQLSFIIAFASLFIPNLIFGRITAHLIGNRWPFIASIIISLCMCATFDRLGFITFLPWIVLSNILIGAINTLLRYEYEFKKIPDHPFGIINTEKKRNLDGLVKTSYSSRISMLDFTWAKLKYNTSDLQGVWYIYTWTELLPFHMIRIASDTTIKFAIRPSILGIGLKLKRFIHFELIKQSDTWYAIDVYFDLFGFTVPYFSGYCEKVSSNKLRIFRHSKNGMIFQFSMKRILYTMDDSIKTTNYTNEVIGDLQNRHIIWV